VAYFARLEWGPLLSGYLGLLLMGAMFLAIGVLASSLTENQIVAAISTFGVLLIFWVIGWSAENAGGNLGKVLSHLSILEHYDSFAKGAIDTRDVLYYLDFTGLSLFLTLLSLQARRWNG
jgi:ABC-2 type transport system permease protein